MKGTNMRSESQIVTVDLINDVNLIDFRLTKFIDNDDVYYSLSITCVQDEPRVINIIFTNTVTNTIQEMVATVQNLLDIGIFDGNKIVIETDIDVFDGSADKHSLEKLNWEDYGLKVQ
jgi:hypothetical protein